MAGHLRASTAAAMKRLGGEASKLNGPRRSAYSTWNGCGRLLMRRLLQGGAICLLAHMAAGQTVPSGTLHSTTTLVVVPTLVQTSSGEPVPNLHARDFVLTDNGVVQAVSIEQA